MDATAVIVGEGTIAALCGDTLLEHGVTIVGVVTGEPELVSWAERHGVPRHPAGDLRAALAATPFDHLFSIVNPAILTPDVLALPRRRAVNFHDGPLPRYAGVHATSWALINGESRHAVTWHEMTAGADEGPILAQRWFDVAEGETAFTLNARCYAEGAASFAEMLPGLLSGDLTARPQDLTERTWFGRHDRPDPVLDFRRPAESLRALVAGLDFGPYPNPLGRPAVWLGDDLAAVAALRVTDRPSTRPPGTLVGADGGELRVATASSDVLLKLADDRSVDALPELADTTRSAVRALTAEVARNERHWLGRLRELAVPDVSVEVTASEDDLPAVLAFLARLAPGPVDVALTDPHRTSRYPAPFFAHTVPWRVPVDPARPFADAVPAVRQSLDRLRHRATYPADLPARYDLKVSLPVTVTVADGPVRFARPEHHRWFAAFRRGLEGGGPVGQIPLIDDAERDTLLAWSHSGPRPATETCVHALVEAAVAAHPTAPAIRVAGRTVSYGEVDRRANRLAHRLIAQGVTPGTVVGLRVPRSVDLVVGLLGILKAGGVYLPLDPGYPADRLDHMVADSRASVVLDDTAAPGHPDTDPRVALAPDAPAYVIYTSGSTGRPKGCAVEHRHLATTLLAARREFGFEAGDLFPNLASHSFDISLLELLLPLVSGGTTVLVTGRPDDLGEVVAQTTDVTFFHAVPSLMSAWLERLDGGDYPRLRCVFVGGDAVPRTVLTALRSRFPAAQVVELYGPTEATIISTFHRVGDQPRPDVAHCIGRPFDHTSAYVLDTAMRLVPVGVAGELHLGGATIARGYLHRDELTAGRFVADPFGPPGRLYRTGDRVRWLPDGTLEFLGRTDGQVKVRGFRVEPGEIEHVLGQHELVDGAVVVARDTPAGRQLVGYVTSRAPRLPDLRAHLARTLPDHLVPAHIVRLPRLPVTANGKVDRAALPAPELPDGYTAPRTPTEALLCEIWADLLGVPRVGVEDNFFALGGHSLLATRLATAVRARLHVDIPVRTIFAAPTVAALAATLHRPATTAVPRLPDTDRYPLSRAQQRIWLHEQARPGTAYYAIPPVLVQIDGPLDVPALEQALTTLVRRHESLRTAYDPAEPVQTVTPGRFRLERADDLSVARRYADEPFDLAGGVPLRAALVTLAPPSHVLVLSMHHIASDGASLAVLFDELGTLYRGRPLPPQPLRYVDHAAWDRRRTADPGYWSRALAGLPAVHGLPLDRPRPKVQSHRGALLVRALPGREALNRLARDHHTTLFTVLETAFAVLLHRYSGADDIAVGTPVANRDHADTAGLVGCFVNTVVLRTDLSEPLTFTDLLGRTATTVVDALAHADVPFEDVVSAVNPPRDTAHHPLFQVMFALEDSHAPHLAGTATSLRDPDYRVAKFDLSLYVRDDGTGLRLVWEYATDLFDADTVATLADSFEALVAGALADPRRPVADLPVLGAPAAALLDTWSAPPTGFPDGCVHELFEARAAATPDAVALVLDGRTTSYGELNARANRLAHHLIAAGVGPDDLVGLRVRRSLELLVGVYGVWKAGAAYVPLDPDLPEARLRQMSQELTAVLTADDLAGCADCPDTDPGRRATGGNLAYVIHTSGSTGTPKGVMVEHRALVNRIDWMDREFRLTPDDVVLHKTPIGFDVSVWELTWPLVTGARLVIAAPDGHRDPRYLVDLVRAERVTTLHFVPSMLRALLDHGGWAECGSVRQVFCSGEALPRAVEADFFATGTRAQLHNLYGPTEAAIDVSHWRCSPDSTLDRVPIGRAIQNITLHVLDGNLRRVPPGVPGELHIGGVGLARGYLHRPDLTAERFVTTPLGRLYRTGDLVRARRDGVLEFLGRTDQQVKIRGLRIELGEIEAVLARHPDVTQAVVVARGEQLVAYVAGGADPDRLRAHLSQWLPEYMLPAAYVPVSAIPVNHNGKVDHAALPEPVATVEETPLESAVEHELAAIWRDLLGLSGDLGAHTNFFHAGGHSLLATRLVAEIRTRWRVDLGLTAVFTHQTLRALARAIDGVARRDEAVIAPVPRDQPIPLSFAQQRFWLLDQLDPGSQQHAVMLALRLDGPLDVGALEETLRTLVARHEILRTGYRADDGRPVQEVRAHVDVRLPVQDIDAADLDTAVGAADLDTAIRAEHGRPFDLTADPMLRARLLRLAADSHVLVLSVHHIASDGWSNAILYREINATYRALTRGEQPPLEPVVLQYADYAAWERAHLAGPALADGVAYWASELAGVPARHSLPLDRPRPPVRSRCGDVVHQHLDAELAGRLHALARDTDATLFMVLHAAFAALVGRYSHATDVVVGTATANRARPETAGVVGPFMSPVALRADLSDDPSFRDLVAQSRRRAIGAYEHQHVPFELVLDELGVDRGPACPPLIQLMLILHNNDGGAIDLPGLRATDLRHAHAQARLDLTLDVVETGGGLEISWEYASDLFDRTTIERAAANFARLLRGAVAAPDTRLSRLPLLDDDELRTTLAAGTGAELAYPRTLLHELFETHAARRPDAVAVVDGDRTISYGDLDARANQVAHALIGRGVRPGDLVGVRTRRSIEMAVGFLGVLKAGAGYVPVDPDLPPARVAAITAEAPLACLLDQDDRYDGPTHRPTRPGGDPSDVAYAIFTSGSSGGPKGVLVEHGAILSSYHAWRAVYQLDGPTRHHLQLAGIGFDVCVGDLVRALCSGGRLVICPKDTLLDPPALHRLIEEQQVHFAEFVPLALRNLVDHLHRTGRTLTTLRYLVAGSDTWHGEDLRRTRQVVADHTVVVNSYGLTEAGVDSTCHLSAPGDDLPAGPVPIGAPLPNVRAYVLDAAGQPCPIGVVGELHLGGPALARGYLNDSALTAERFVADPFRPGGRLLRTGDLARWGADGQLELAGRVDAQVKIRGFRIELGEIEACLLAHPAVAETVVVDVPGPSGERLLAAYVVGAADEGAAAVGAADENAAAVGAADENVAVVGVADEGAAVGVADEGAAVGAADVDALREHLQARLPEYMVPAAIVPLDRLPTNTNGKVDRAALPAPRLRAADHHVPAGTATEHALVGMWESLLGVESPSVRASFFALGGHSLLATRLVAMVNDRWRVRLPVRAVFAQATIRALARIVDQAVGDGAAVGERPGRINRVDRTGRCELSAGQRRLWLVDQLEPGSPQYNVATALRLDGDLDVPALEGALGAIVARHEVLRTTYHSVDGEPHQRVHAPAGFTLARMSATTEELDDIVRAQAREPFDLATGPVLRAVLVTLTARSHVLLLTMHHIAADGWSMGILATELTEGYRTLARGLPDRRPPLDIQYADYAAWERHQLTDDALTPHLRYWQEKLDGLPAVHSLPLDRPRPARQSYRGATHTVTIGADTLTALRDLATARDVTLFNVLHTALVCLLARHGDEPDIVVGTPVANRDRTEVAPLIGFFVNTVVLRSDLTDDPSFTDLLRRSHRDVLDALEHQALPFDRIVERLAPERSASHHPVFQILLALQNNDQGTLDLPGLSVSVFKPDTETAKFDLTLDVLELPDALRLDWEYATDLFEPATVRRLAAHFARLLAAIVEDPAARPSQVSLLDATDRRVLDRWNATERPYDRDHVVHRYVAEQPADDPAVSAYGATLSYGELDRRGNRLARLLVDRGVGRDVVVALFLPRDSIHLIVSVLAVFKAGGAYVALDLDTPAARLEHILRDAGAAVVLTTSATADRAPGRTVCVDDPALDGYSDAPVPDRVRPDDIAYLIYTSGTTGLPKALVQTHRTLENLVSMPPRPDVLAGRTTMLQYAALSFDVSIQEIATAWKTGSELVLISAEDRADPAALLDLLESRRIGRLFIPTAMLYLIADEYLGGRPRDLSALREIIVGGEALTVTGNIRTLVERNDIVFVNEYGPSETHAATYEVVEDLTVGGQPPVGLPIGNLRMYVVDRFGQRQPVGLPGELFIGGDGVARGYLNQPELTAERFVQYAGERVYRSGDRVRFLPDGKLRYLGRMDHQVKIRGYRIELGEIEQVLQRHPAVRDAVVVAREDRQLLVAYVALDRPCDVEVLRDHVSARVPEYMVPAAVVTMDELPLTRVGKIDRRRLPEPDLPTAGPVEPTTATERALLPVWRDILGAPHIGVRDNFFALGGHSLLAVRLATAIRTVLGKPVPLRSIVECPTVAELARRLEGEAGEAGPVGPLTEDPADAYEPFPLTEVQQAYWVGRSGHFDLGNIGTHSYIETPADGLDLDRYQWAWNQLVQRHPMLRMVLTPDGRQRILEHVPEYVFAVHDGGERLAVRERMSHQVFSGYEWPLFEVCVSRESETRSWVHLSIDAFSLDAASYLQLFREWMHLYQHPDQPLPPLTITFRDYVLSERRLRASSLADASRAYWTQRIADFPTAPDLPFAVDPSEIDAPYFEGRRHFVAPAAWARLKQVAARLRITPTVLVIGCFAEVLTRWSRHPRYALNLTLFNRFDFHEEVHRLIGDFTSLTLLEIDHRDPDTTLAGRLTAIQRRLFTDLEHRYFSGVAVQREVSRRHAESVTYPVVVTSTLGLDNRLHDDGTFDHDRTYTVSQTPQVWLDFQLSEIEGALSCNWDAVRDLFPEGLLDDMFASFTGLLDRLAAEPDLVDQARLDTLPAAHRALAADANATATRPVPEATGLHQPLLDQIRRRGDKTAVVAAGRRVSYRQLGLASQRLAARVRSTAPVAILMRKGWEQVVAALAVLRAGAAYLPVDADLPAERIRTLLDIGEVTQVLTTPGVDSPVPAIVVDESLLADGELDLADHGRPHDLAYVIFTSGSTGTPKGVMIDHRGALNTVLDITDRHGVTADDTVLGLSSLSFDLSVYDIFGILGAGGTLVLPRPEEARDPEAWLRHVQREQVTVWNTVPALMGMLADLEPARLPLRLVLLSGDWIPVTLPGRIAGFAPDARVVSLGGATEASIWSIEHPIDRVDPAWRSIPYGRPLANQHVYVLKQDLDPAPVHATGDIHIGGVGVALGYWRDPDRTAASFITHPRTGERLYRTGDLGRLLPDGTIEFLGRDDLQVKVQGHRIELGEIETRLAEHPEIREAAVTTHDAGRTRQLVAYVVPDTGNLALHGDVIDDESARQLFTMQRRGIRSDLPAPGVTLPVRPAVLRDPGRPLPGPVTLDDLARLFATLGEESVPHPKRHYPSAGTLYPVQVYLVARDVDGLAPGCYYHHPVDRNLVPTSTQIPDGPGAATVHLVVDTAAIAPLYGRNSEDFYRLEAGYLTYLLERGGALLRPVPAGDVAPAFRLTDTHRPLAAFTVHPTDGTGQVQLSLAARKSYRTFARTPVDRRALLAVLREDPALRVQVWLRDAGWHDLDGGRLVPAPDDRDPAVVFRHCGDILATAAFAVLLVGERTDDTLHRAGALGQAMMTAAPAGHLGLCPIGVVDGCLHAFLGGPVTDEQLRSYDVSRPADHLARSVQDFLAARLPAHMVPAQVIRIDTLPLSANGKVDRRALPAPDAGPDDGTHVAPATTTEHALSAIWQQVLDRPAVGVTDNFFQLGGDSMLAIAVLTAARRQGIRFSVRDLYTQQTIRRLARVAVTADDPDEPAYEPFSMVPADQRATVDAWPGRLADAYPQTALQQGMIFHNLIDGDRGTYHEVISTHLRLPWDEERFRAALRTLTARHDVLRTVFRDELQLVLAEVEPELLVVDIRHLDAPAQAAHVRDWVAAERRRPFAPDRPAWLVAVHLRGDDEVQYSLACHHAMLDGWSVARFDTELFDAYRGTPAAAGTPMPYRRFVADERAAGASERAREHWTTRLLDAPVAWWTGARRGEQRRRAVPVDPDTARRIGAVARSLGVPDRSVFLAAHVALVALVNGTSDVVTSVVTNCRPEVEGAERSLGLFLNSLPLRVDRRGLSWSGLIRAVEAAQLDDLPFRMYPLAAIQADTKLDLTGSLFTYVNFRVGGSADVLGDDSVDTTNYLLATEVARDEAAQTFRVALVADDGAFDPTALDRVAGYYARILADLVADADRTIDNTRLLGPAETHRLLVEWNDTTHPFPDHTCLHELFQQRVARSPDAVALTFEGRTMTYADLNARANRLAHHLIARGVRPDDLVGLSVPRSFAMLVGIYGIWKAGAAYVPLEPDYPAARLRQLGEGLVTTLTEEDITRPLPEQPDTDPENRATPDHLAYVIYTSGSTGTPKGVMVTHRSLVNRIHWMQSEYGLTGDDVVLQKTPYSFDVSVWELTWPLVVGARLAIARPGGHRDPGYLVRVITGEAVTTLHFVPPMLQAMLDHGHWAECSSVRRVFCSGEALPAAVRSAFFDTGTRASLHNLYGPTEATIDVSHWTCRPGETSEQVPIGRPIHNTHLHVLDRDGALLPPGVPGELHIGGVGLARGYLGRPDLTGERFVTTTFAGRLYRTGDLVRRRDDGVIEFLGRIDDQVKIRGFRVEPGEIEAVLLAHPAVRHAVVVARAGRLAGYVMAPPEVDLRSYLAGRLPDFMVPATVTHVARIPLGPNGKVDRAALPDPDRPVTVDPPRNPVEARLCAIVADLLDLHRVGVHESFLDIGGDSLRLVRLGLRIRAAFGVELSVMALYDAATVARMAALIAGGRVDDRIVHRLTPPRDTVRQTILCVPYGAGDGVVYQALADQVGDDVAVLSITNPRTFDPADPAQLTDFLDRTVAEIREQTRGPVTLWGHCLGYSLALLLARTLPEVTALFLGGVTIDPDHAGRTGPAPVVDRADIVAMLTTAGLAEIQGTITGEEWELVADKFRHDLALSHHCDRRFFTRPSAALAVPVHCVVAEDDPLTEDWRQNATNWRLVAERVEVVHLDGGGHYFVQTRPRQVADLLTRRSAVTAAGPDPEVPVTVPAGPPRATPGPVSPRRSPEDRTPPPESR